MPEVQALEKPITTSKNVLLEVKSLKKYFPIEKGFLRRVTGHVKAVDDISFTGNGSMETAKLGEWSPKSSSAITAVVKI